MYVVRKVALRVLELRGWRRPAGDMEEWRRLWGRQGAEGDVALYRDGWNPYSPSWTDSSSSASQKTNDHYHVNNRDCYLFWAKVNQFIESHAISLRYIWVNYSYLLLGPRSGLAVLHIFQPKFYIPFCMVRHTPLDRFIKIFGDEYQLETSSLSGFSAPVSAYVLSQHSVLRHLRLLPLLWLNNIYTVLKEKSIEGGKW